MKKKLGANDFHFGHLTFMLSLHYLVECRSCSLAAWHLFYWTTVYFTQLAYMRKWRHQFIYCTWRLSVLSEKQSPLGGAEYVNPSLNSVLITYRLCVDDMFGQLCSFVVQNRL